MISHIGSADDGTDPNLLSNIENMVDLKLAKDWRWKWHKNKQKLIQDMSENYLIYPELQHILHNIFKITSKKLYLVLKVKLS